MKTLLYTVFDSGYTSPGLTPYAKIYDVEGKLELEAINPNSRRMLDPIEFKETLIPLSDKAAYCDALEKRLVRAPRPWL